MSKILKRTDMCGELRIEDEGRDVVLNGWISKSRNLGGVIFCDLRDRTGIVQLIFDDKTPAELFEKADSLRSEFVVGVRGKIAERTEKNPDMATGDVEVFVNHMEIYSKSDTPPIYIKDDDNVDDNLRLKYRYLDLRKNKLQQNLTMRHEICKVAREYFDSEGFREIETPMLIKPTPEGARDYLVPSRVNMGEFYALPQSPQMFKQLLMVSGVDRYLQITKCFRDEDLRADRQPEFTQIDLEMSFVDVEQVLEIQEGFLKKLFKDILDVDIKLPLPRLSYDEAMNRFGSDKPDLRFGFELKDLSGTVRDTEFKVFKDALEGGGSVRGIAITGGAEQYTRKKIDKLIKKSADYGAKGLVWIKQTEGEITSSVNKFFTKEELYEIAGKAGASEGDLVLICADTDKTVFDTLGFLRRHIAEEMNLLNDKEYSLLWVVDFPMFEEDEQTGEVHAVHHPFTSPVDEDKEDIINKRSTARAQAYDIVLNGVELGGGSIRIHERKLQEDIFSILGFSEEEIIEKFGFLVEAFKFGAPPHGGIAYGLDRLAMLFCGENSIREVIAFPKNQAAQCMVSGAPSQASDEQLQELGIKINETIYKE